MVVVMMMTTTSVAFLQIGIDKNLVVVAVRSVLEARNVKGESPLLVATCEHSAFLIWRCRFYP